MPFVRSFVAKHGWLLASLAWVALLLGFFFPVVFQGKVLAPLDILDHLMRPWSDGAGGFGVHNAFTYDAISQYLPYEWAVRQSLRNDGFIGWNPWCFGGYALLENTMICPGDWHHQLYRFLGFWTAWNLGIVLQFALAGFGVLLMLRGEGLPAFAALVGAIAYAFYSQHVLWIYHRWILGASCWFPWMVWAVRRARRKNRLADFWSVVFTTMALRGGHLQACLFAAVILFCVFLEEWLEREARWHIRTILSVVAPYAILTALSSVLFADVLLNTIPPFLEGCKDLPPKTILQALSALPTLVTVFIPTLCGAPLTLDAFKAVGGDLFDIKFVGAIPLVLALPAIASRKAPRLPKLFFIVGLLLPFTPLIQWLYSRVTVVFALGSAWLAVWTLAHSEEIASNRLWRTIGRSGLALLTLWMVASVVLLAIRPRVEPILHRFVEIGLPASKASRLDWMLARADAFLESLQIWRPLNLVPVLLVLAGLFSAWRLSRSGRTRWIAAIVLCVFGELFVWSRIWITFSDRPNPSADNLLYPDPDWAKALREETHGSGLVWMCGTRPDFDYLQFNAQAGLDIAAFQGYETIRPARLDEPDSRDLYDPAAFAARGVSHALVLPGSKPPDGLTNWIERIDSDALHVYRNPVFDSRWHAILADGSRIPIRDSDSSANRHRFSLPAGTVSVSLSEPFHPAWQDTPPPGLSTTASRRNDGGTLVAFDHPLDTPAELVRSFRKKDLLFWPQLAALAFLAVISHIHTKESTYSTVKPSHIHSPILFLH